MFTNHHQQHQTSKISFPALRQTMDSKLQETSASVPKMVKPITTVPPANLKGRHPPNLARRRRSLPN